MQLGLKDWHTKKWEYHTKKNHNFFWFFFKNWGNGTQKQKIMGTQSKFHANTQKLFMINMNIKLKEKVFFK